MTADASAPILEVENLSVTIEGRDIVSGVSFEIRRRESVAIIGPNGAGKTVLLKSLIGVLPHRGRMQWHGAVRIGYVPQKIGADRSLPLNVHDVLEAKARILHVDAASIERAIASVGLDPRAVTTHLGDLSGGQFQRAMIALAFLGKPDIVFLDEPTASMDESGEERIYDLLHRVQEEYGVALVTVSHDMFFVNRYADQVVCINGRQLCYGPPGRVMTPALLHDLFGDHTVHEHHHER
ncbi:MAG: metal ABC transporter ATP-binding protein [Thermoanaerobaculia bacterium]